MITAYSIAQLISTLVNFYEMLVLVYIIMRWFPLREGGLAYDIAMVLQSICEPFLGLFRRFIPPMGGIDFSPVIAILALNLIARFVIGIII
ncbi:YggT family protein [Enorma phocaeensis]|uniref:YggT family protein n=1 Tax=Enorma phocaeensis TaxID=1871019 RepID=UPI00315DF08D